MQTTKTPLPSSSTAAAAGRLYYLDNLRVFITMMVIAHHVGQAYGPTGGYWPIMEPTSAALLGPFFTVNRSFFMSIFFMISGYLMVMSYDRSAPGTFVITRLRRLGAPLAVFGLVMSLTFKFVLNATGPAGSVLSFGHLWYLEHLLLLSLVYALLRVLRKRPVPTGLEHSRLPGLLAILALALAVAVVSGVVRIWYPIDRWINLLGFIQVAPSDVPRDLAFFIFGTLAFRRQWFQRFPTRAGKAWLAVGVGAAALWYGYKLSLQRVLPLAETAMDIVYLLWESLLCFGLCIGLLVLFRENVGSQRPLGRKLAEAQYAAYVFHLPIVLLLQFLAKGLALSPLAKFGLVTAGGIPFTFAVSYLLRRPLR